MPSLSTMARRLSRRLDQALKEAKSEAEIAERMERLESSPLCV